MHIQRGEEQIRAGHGLNQGGKLPVGFTARTP